MWIGLGPPIFSATLPSWVAELHIYPVPLCDIFESGRSVCTCKPCCLPPKPLLPPPVKSLHSFAFMSKYHGCDEPTTFMSGRTFCATLPPTDGTGVLAMFNRSLPPCHHSSMRVHYGRISMRFQLIPVLNGRCQLIISGDMLEDVKVLKREAPTGIAQMLDDYERWIRSDLPASTFASDADMRAKVLAALSSEDFYPLSAVRAGISVRCMEECVSLLESCLGTASD